ncbi:MAG: DNA/RNA non-specific endonuclease [Lachnospiraceae bacterium]|nr:DNA/RNA non-specific endonuclease [Lachnospiraceae bacterium]
MCLCLLLMLIVASVIIYKVVSKKDYATQIALPSYTGQAYVEINDNTPYFTEDEMITESFEVYSELDDLGRCGIAYANLSKETMPTEERGEIGMIKPTGWRTVKYPDIIDDLYLYNRCHLIAFCLAGENANEKNLITGTRYMNVKGMLPFEEKVAKYLDSSDNHVLYRVTPMFEGSNLVASGVMIEAYSIEDNGKGICFCVYCFNVQPGINIDYATGESRVE